MDIVTGAGLNRKMVQALLFSLAVLLVTGVSIIEAQQDLVRYKDVDRINEALETFLPVNIAKKSFSDSRLDVKTSADTSNKCSEQVKLLVNGLKSGKTWALQMIDASSKLPSGILMGNRVDLGTYDECVAIRVIEADEEIRGRHCMYRILAKLGEIELSETLSICLPAACEPEDIKPTLDEVLKIITDETDSDTPISIAETTCSTVESREWTAGGIITIFGFSLLLLFLAVCTICDILLRNYKDYFSTYSQLLLLSEFSIYSNGIRILSTKTTPQTLPAIQGLRFFSMCWVILGHEFFVSRYSLPVNSADLLEWAFSWNSVYIMLAPFAVDTFFTISGFLMSYLFLKDMSKGRNFNIFKYYIHRYLRLTPAYAAVLLMTIFIFPRIGSGAIWEKNMGNVENNCRNNWFPMLLYVHNYVNKESLICLGHTWYLAVEMHFFWLSPVILYPLAKKPKIGLAILTLLWAAAIIIPAVIAHDEELASGMVVNNPNVKSMTLDFYTATHNRAAAWLIGIFFGYMIFKTNGSPSRWMKLIGWLFAVTAFLFCLFGTRNFQLEGYEYDKVWETFFTAVSRPAWSAAVAWIICACIRGFGGPITTFLSLGIFQPFSRISYCMYLVHFIIQTMKVSAIRVPRYFSDFDMFNYFLSDFILSVVVGLAFSLIFESPILTLEKLVLKGGKGRNDASKREVKDNEQVENGVDNHGPTTDL